MDNVQIAEYIIYFNIIVNICLLVFFYIKKANSKYKLIGWINFILYIILFIGIILYTLPMRLCTYFEPRKRVSSSLLSTQICVTFNELSNAAPATMPPPALPL